MFHDSGVEAELCRSSCKDVLFWWTFCDVKASADIKLMTYSSVADDLHIYCTTLYMEIVVKRIYIQLLLIFMFLSKVSTSQHQDVPHLLINLIWYLVCRWSVFFKQIRSYLKNAVMIFFVRNMNEKFCHCLILKSYQDWFY